MQSRIVLTGLTAVLFSGAVNAQTANKAPKKLESNFSIVTDLTDIKSPVKKIFISWYNTTTKVRYTDSAEINGNNKVTFNTLLDEPILAQVWVVPVDAAERPNYERDYYNVFVEPGKLNLKVNGSLGKSEVTGSTAHLEYLKLKGELDSYTEVRKQIVQEAGKLAKENNETGNGRVRRAVDSLQQVINEKVYKGYIVANPSSPVALYALSQYAGYDLDPAKVEPVYAKLGSALQKSSGGKSFRERIELAKKLEIGQYALDFSQNDTAGIAVKLSSFKGKYVLVDFWASWCGPCRAENPNVVKAFNKYSAKGFTVLGVSLDKPGQREKWLQAISVDHLTWTHVSDLAFWNNTVAKLYGVLAIPQNYLIDPQGKIVGKNLRGEELESTLAKLLE